ncbi:MAG: tRNA pseudouridine(55) synthase TruB [Rhodospirillales bacterium]|nr:tRNA pseudouridine(55) synthase TruB [Rhodospirillales bacterium]
MNGKKARDKVDGWVILDKPVGPTSTQALGRVRRVFNAAKGGHAGTLDPLASGVLPIALGEATKTLAHFSDGTKEYEFAVRWGIATASDDAEGEVTATSDVRPAQGSIAAALPRFTGEIDQTPPVYSAIKIDGERAYALARAGETVAMKSRKVLIHKLELLETPSPDEARLRLSCGPGTYVRSLARDLALALGTVGHVTALRRTAVGRFRVESAISLDKLEAFGHSPARFGALAPVETVLDDIPALAVTAEEAAALRQGRSLRDPRAEHSPPEPGALAVFHDGKLVALADGDGGFIRPARVFNL